MGPTTEPCGTPKCQKRYMIHSVSHVAFLLIIIYIKLRCLIYGKEVIYILLSTDWHNPDTLCVKHASFHLCLRSSIPHSPLTQPMALQNAFRSSHMCSNWELCWVSGSLSSQFPAGWLFLNTWKKHLNVWDKYWWFTLGTRRDHIDPCGVKGSIFLFFTRP